MSVTVTGTDITDVRLQVGGHEPRVYLVKIRVHTSGGDDFGRALPDRPLKKTFIVSVEGDAVEAEYDTCDAVLSHITPNLMAAKELTQYEQSIANRSGQ